MKRDHYRDGLVIVLTKPLKKRCCLGDIPVDATVAMIKRTSPDRALIEWRSADGFNSLHKVKLSRIQGR